jgi:hypothetical protein
LNARARPENLVQNVDWQILGLPFAVQRGMEPQRELWQPIRQFALLDEWPKQADLQIALSCHAFQYNHHKTLRSFTHIMRRF